MKADLIRIGNSRGLRIPKPLIDQSQLGNTVELRVDNNCLVNSPVRRLRQGWPAAFRSAGSSGGDDLLLEGANKFDRKEWQW